jgi:hypothetical protein
MARPPKDNEPRSIVALQATLLAEAAKAGVPVDPDTLKRVGAILGRFTEADLLQLEAVAGSSLALEALARLADDNPEAFLRQYANLMEFSKPRLARVEHKGDGTGLAGIFISVEAREAGPPPAARVVSSQDGKGNEKK